MGDTSLQYPAALRFSPALRRIGQLGVEEDGYQTLSVVMYSAAITISRWGLRWSLRTVQPQLLTGTGTRECRQVKTRQVNSKTLLRQLCYVERKEPSIDPHEWIDVRLKKKNKHHHSHWKELEASVSDKVSPRKLISACRR